MDNALELAVQFDREGDLLALVATSLLDGGGLQPGDAESATRVAAIAGTGPRGDVVRRAVVARLIARRDLDGARSVAAQITSADVRAEAFIDGATSLYPRDSSTNALLREALTVLENSQSPNRAWRLQQAVAELLRQGDWATLERVSSKLAPDERLQMLLAIASQVRFDRPQLADSVFAVAKEATSTANETTRASLMASYWSSYSPGAADSAYQQIAAGIPERSTRHIYLSNVATWLARLGDIDAAIGIANEMLAAGDTSTALSALSNAANAIAYGPHQDAVAIPLDAMPMLERMREIVGSNPRRQWRSWSNNAMSVMARIDLRRALELARQTGLANVDAYVLQALVTSLSALDVREALDFARSIPSSTNISYALRSISERQANAGYLNEAMATTALIDSAAVRAVARMNVVRVQVQAGDTTGVRAVILAELPSLNMPNDMWVFTYSVVGPARRVGMLNDVVAWARSLPENVRAHALVGVVNGLRY
jgi:hypothetical protein